MSEDDIDNLIVWLVEWVENELNDNNWFNDDIRYNSFSDLVYEKLERFVTKDRNYN